MPARTSASHPLAIAEIRPAPETGRIGITFCPGKHQSDAATGVWRRDLAADLERIADWGAAAVVSLVEEHELAALKVPRLGQEVNARHMLWRHLPIPDVTAPGPAFEAGWVQAGPEIRDLLRHGFDVLVHCKGGLGRAGTIAARLLVELGWSPIEAVKSVRAVRPGAIETEDQLRHVHALAAGNESALRPPLDATDRGLGALLGLAVGDAVGTTLEFARRDANPPLTDMVGGGPFDLQPGQWTDDTAMALALADSLIVNGRLDQRDLMDRFCAWWQEGRYSCTGDCFDIGIATRSALERYQRSGDPVAGDRSANAAGNGSLMRLAPVVLHAMADNGDDTPVQALARRQSEITHATPACLDACAAFARLLELGLSDHPLSEMLAIASAESEQWPHVAPILAGSWRGKHRRDIGSSGYVLHSFEAAIWCVARTTSFREAVLLAANLADDADTTAAIAGQLAGVLYGRSGIPEPWLLRLAWRDKIEKMALALMKRRN